MTLQVGTSATTATPAQLASLRASIGVGNSKTSPFGAALFPSKYTGVLADAAQTSGTLAHFFPFTSPPADAVAVELWVNADGPTDYLFCSLVSGRLSANGANATDIAANLASCRSVTGGAKLILPLVTKGVVPSTWRFAFGVASGASLQGRYISESELGPYLCASTTEFVLTGAGASQQLPYSDTSRFPVGTTGFVMQVTGSTPARVTVDGTVPTATRGAIVRAGTYLVDYDRDGFSVSALRMYLPTGTNVVGNTLKSA